MVVLYVKDGNFKDAELHVGSVDNDVVVQPAPGSDHGGLTGDEADQSLIGEVQGGDFAAVVSIQQHVHDLNVGFVVDVGSDTVFLAQVLTQLVVQTADVVGVNVALAVPAGAGDLAGFVLDSQLLGNFEELVPGLGDVSLGQASLFPVSGIVEDRTGHVTDIQEVNIAVDDVGAKEIRSMTSRETSCRHVQNCPIYKLYLFRRMLVIEWPCFVRVYSSD